MISYFSESSRVERFFEMHFGNQIETSFNGPLSHFLGMSFSHSSDSKGQVTINLSQLPFIESLQHSNTMERSLIKTTPTPFRSGLPIDSIPDHIYSPDKQKSITIMFQHLVGILVTVARSGRVETVSHWKHPTKC